jgi:hypothetical protein
MGKVPVGRTIGHAYGFLAARLAAVLGLGWLPAVFYAAAAWYCLQRMGAVMAVSPPSSAAFNQFTAFDFLALLVATALLVPTVAVPFAQLALGRPREPVAAHFVFGGREWRMFLALLCFYAVVIAVLALLALGCQIAIGIGLPPPGSESGGFAMPADLYGAPISLWLDGATTAILAIAFLFLTVRFGFFLPASAAAEDKVTLRRAWVLSRGNSWRLAVVYVVVALPPVLLLGAATYAVESAGLADVLRTGWSAIPSEGMSALYKLQYDHAGALAAIGAVGLVLTNALFAGASAAAYQALEAAAAMPEVSRERAEPDFASAWAPATADTGMRRHHEAFAVARTPEPKVAPIAHDHSLVVEPEPVLEPVAQSEPVVPEVIEAPPPAEEPVEITVQPASGISAPDTGAEPTQEAAAAAESDAPPEPVQPPPTPDMAPPLDPAGAMAMRDQITPPQTAE